MGRAVFLNRRRLKGRESLLERNIVSAELLNRCRVRLSTTLNVVAMMGVMLLPTFAQSQSIRPEFIVSADAVVTGSGLPEDLHFSDIHSPTAVSASRAGSYQQFIGYLPSPSNPNVNESALATLSGSATSSLAAGEGRISGSASADNSGFVPSTDGTVSYSAASNASGSSSLYDEFNATGSGTATLTFHVTGTLLEPVTPPSNFYTRAGGYVTFEASAGPASLATAYFASPSSAAYQNQNSTITFTVVDGDFSEDLIVQASFDSAHPLSIGLIGNIYLFTDGKANFDMTLASVAFSSDTPLGTALTSGDGSLKFENISSVPEANTMIMALCGIAIFSFLPRTHRQAIVVLNPARITKMMQASLFFIKFMRSSLSNVYLTPLILIAIAMPAMAQYFPNCERYKNARCLEKCSKDTAYECYSTCLFNKCTQADEELPPPDISRMPENDRKVRENIQNARRGFSNKTTLTGSTYDRQPSATDSTQTHKSSANMSSCIQIRRDGNSASFVNNCQMAVTIAWCTEGGDFKCGQARTYSTSAGKIQALAISTVYLRPGQSEGISSAGNNFSGRPLWMACSDEPQRSTTSYLMNNGRGLCD